MPVSYTSRLTAAAAQHHTLRALTTVDVQVGQRSRAVGAALSEARGPSLLLLQKRGQGVGVQALDQEHVVLHGREVAVLGEAALGEDDIVVRIPVLCQACR